MISAVMSKKEKFSRFQNFTLKTKSLNDKSSQPLFNFHLFIIKTTKILWSQRQKYYGHDNSSVVGAIKNEDKKC
jgi:hypothetical protein